jgi:hypothetical protein
LADNQAKGIHGFLIVGRGIGRAGGTRRRTAQHDDHHEDYRDAHANILSA